MQKPPDKSTHMPLTPSQSGILHLLWKEHSGAVYAMLLDWCGNKTNAADILQEVFLRLARNPSSLENIRQPRAFLFVSARRIGIDLARRNKIEEAAVESGDLEIFPTQHGVPPGDDLHQILQDAFKLLPEEQQTVLEAKLLHGKTLALIASEQGISLNTASSRLRYSLDKMRIVLRPYYVTMKKSYLNPNASQRLSSSSSVNERLIKPLEPKRVPSVSPLLAGLVALAPEHDTHDTLSDIPVSVDTHTDQTAATSDHPADTQDHTPSPAVEAAPSDSSNPLPVSAQDPEVVLTSVFEDAQVDNVASITPEPFALESFLILNTTQVSTENSGNYDTTVTDTGVATPSVDESSGAVVDNNTSHDVTSTDPSTTYGQSIDPTTGLPVDNSGIGTDPAIDPSTGFVTGTDHFMNFGGIQFSNDGGAAIGYGGIDHTYIQRDAHQVDATSQNVPDHAVSSVDPTLLSSNVSAASVGPAPSSPSFEASTHEAAVNPVNSASPAQHSGSVYYDPISQNSSTSNLAQNQEGPSSVGHFSEIGVAEHQGVASINLNQPIQEGLSYVSPNLNFYGVENTHVEGSHDGALDSDHSPNSHEELPSKVQPATVASIHDTSKDDFSVISETPMTETPSHHGGNETSPITEHSPSIIGTPEILGGVFVAGTATQAAPTSTLAKMVRRSVGK